MERTEMSNHLNWEEIGTGWCTMPQTLTFDELVTSPIFCNYVECYGHWKIILWNGVWYYQDTNNAERGQKCGSSETVDPVCLHRVYPSAMGGN